MTVEFACSAFELISVVLGSQKTGLQGSHQGLTYRNNFKHFFAPTILNISIFVVVVDKE